MQVLGDRQPLLGAVPPGMDPDAEYEDYGYDDEDGDGENDGDVIAFTDVPEEEYFAEFVGAGAGAGGGGGTTSFLSGLKPSVPAKPSTPGGSAISFGAAASPATYEARKPSALGSSSLGQGAARVETAIPAGFAAFAGGSSEWQCEVCTSQNADKEVVCLACQTPRPGHEAAAAAAAAPSGNIGSGGFTFAAAETTAPAMFGGQAASGETAAPGLFGIPSATPDTGAGLFGTAPAAPDTGAGLFGTLPEVPASTAATLFGSPSSTSGFSTVKPPFGGAGFGTFTGGDGFGQDKVDADSSKGATFAEAGSPMFGAVPVDKTGAATNGGNDDHTVEFDSKIVSLSKVEHILTGEENETVQFLCPRGRLRIFGR